MNGIDQLIMEMEMTEVETEQEEISNQEWEMLQNLTEEEALKELGADRIEIFQGLEKVLKGKSALARRVVNFLMEEYPEMIPSMLEEGTLETLVDQRVKEAMEYFAENHRKMQDQEKVWEMDTMQRVQTEQMISAALWEIINKEIFYKPIMV